MQTTPQTYKENRYERFIPNRTSSNLLSLFDKISEEKHAETENHLYTSLLEQQFSPSPRKILNFFPTDKENVHTSLSSIDFSMPNYRKISKIPYKVLDAPALIDDFYLNLLDWSVTNQLIVGLNCSVYIWNAYTSKVTKLTDTGINNCVSSLSSSNDGKFLSIGSNNGLINLWDLSRSKLIRTFNGHTTRVGTLAWNSSIISSGSRDRLIYNRDIRMPKDYISKLTGHKQEICGLKWSFDQQQLCSGGNDNKLIVWNLHSNQPVYKINAHKAAVKALAWSPHQHSLLASGGGTADRTIRYWNTLTGEELACIDSGSQVCGLLFSKNTEELVSTHGYSLNQIMIWDKTKKVTTLIGHSMRVLYLALSPDGQNIVTGAGDETLRFWNVFPGVGPFSQNNTLVLSHFELR